MQVGDLVKFEKLISDDHRDWNMSAMSFNYVRSLLGQIAEIIYIQKHFEDDGTKTYFLDVEYSCGYKMKSVNSLCFAYVDQ